MFYILLERKCIREEHVVGGNHIKHIQHAMFNDTAYESFLSDTFSLLEQGSKFAVEPDLL